MIQFDWLIFFRWVGNSTTNKLNCYCWVVVVVSNLFSLILEVCWPIVLVPNAQCEWVERLLYGTHTHYIPRAPKNLYFWRSTLQNKALFKQNTQLIFSRWRSSVDNQINTMNPIVAWHMPKGIMPKGIGTTTNMNRQLLTDTWNVTQFNDVWGTVTGPALHTRNVWNLFVEPFSSWCERSRMDEPILTKIEGPKANFGRAGSDCSRNCSGNCSPMTHLKTHLELQLQTCLV